MGRTQDDAPVYPSENDEYDETQSGAGCGCFRRFCFGRHDGEGRSYLLRDREAWVETKLKKVRELSEMVAGPKWKNWIRKIGKVFKRQDKAAEAQFDQYSPESYALNFAGDEADFPHSFSSRFAPGYFVNDHQKDRPLL